MAVERFGSQPSEHNPRVRDWVYGATLADIIVRIEELESRLRLACEPCAECGHIDYRELDSIVDGECVTRYSPFTLAAPLACGHPPQDIDPQTGLCESCDRWYAAGTCPATFEAVAEIEDADDGVDGCPLCGLPSYQHRSEGLARPGGPVPEREG